TGAESTFGEDLDKAGDRGVERSFFAMDDADRAFETRSGQLDLAKRTSFRFTPQRRFGQDRHPHALFDRPFDRLDIVELADHFDLDVAALQVLIHFAADDELTIEGDERLAA